MDNEYKQMLIEIGALCSLIAEYDLFAEDMFTEQEIATLAKVEALAAPLDCDETFKIAIARLKELLSNV